MSRVLPCPFVGDMVLALRRIVDPKTMTRRIARHTRPSSTFVRVTPEGALVQESDINGRTHLEVVESPWQPGDRLWVREAWRAKPELDALPPRDIEECSSIHYEATGMHFQAGQWGRLRPPMFMPRWASRMQLEVVARRGERVQDISEADATSEGVAPLVLPPNISGRELVLLDWPVMELANPHRNAFALLWDSINGRRPGGEWLMNPWVWVYTVKVVR